MKNALAVASARTSELGTKTGNPFVCWENLAATATLTGTPTLDDGDRANIVSGTTYDYWLPNVTSTSATVNVELTTSASIGFVGVAVHNLATLGATVGVRRSTDGGATWMTAGPADVTPVDNSPIGFRLVSTGNATTHWRLAVLGLTAGDPVYIGAMVMGPELVFDRPVYQSATPAWHQTEVNSQTQVSEGGNVVGAVSNGRGSTPQVTINNLPRANAEDDAVLGFIDHFNRGKPFFYAWRPDQWDTNLHFAWRQGQAARLGNAGYADLLTLPLSMRAHHDF